VDSSIQDEGGSTISNWTDGQATVRNAVDERRQKQTAIRE